MAEDRAKLAFRVALLYRCGIELAGTVRLTTPSGRQGIFILLCSEQKEREWFLAVDP